LTEAQKEKNKEIAKEIIYVEHLIHIIKTFRIASERFRLKSSRYQQVILVIFGLVRLRIGAFKFSFKKIAERQDDLPKATSFFLRRIDNSSFKSLKFRYNWLFSCHPSTGCKGSHELAFQSLWVGFPPLGAE
jgi:hypothetical protein